MLLHASVIAQCRCCHVPLSNLPFSEMFQNFLHCGNKNKIGMDNCGDGNSRIILNALPVSHPSSSAPPPPPRRQRFKV